MEKSAVKEALSEAKKQSKSRVNQQKEGSSKQAQFSSPA
jgi:hypothetical protein